MPHVAEDGTVWLVLDELQFVLCPNRKRRSVEARCIRGDLPASKLEVNGRRIWCMKLKTFLDLLQQRADNATVKTEKRDRLSLCLGDATLPDDLADHSFWRRVSQLPTAEDREEFTTRQAAEYLGISASKLRRLSDAGALHPDLTRSGYRIFRREELDRYRQQRELQD